MKKICYICLAVLLLMAPAAAGAFDFGLLFANHAEFGNTAGKDDFEYTGNLVPRFSMPVGGNGELSASASVTVGYGAGGLTYYPELTRAELSFRFGNGALRIGRFGYADPSTFIARGPFDGVQYTHGSGAGRFGIGAWYAGFIFKKTANITMTKDDLFSYGLPLDYSDFSNTYFAPSRIIAALDWEHPSVGELVKMNISVLGQIDLTGGNEKINTQYLVLRAGVPFRDFVFEAGGSLGLSQYESPTESAFSLSFACDFGVSWTLPVSINSRLSLSGKYAGGKVSDLIGAFNPVTTKYPGEVFKTRMTALSVVALDYSARLHKTVGAGFSASYFVRNDLVTGVYPITGGQGGFFLGPEFSGRLVWSPYSDLQINLGGGVFVPALGDNWPSAGILWTADLSVSIVLY